MNLRFNAYSPRINEWGDDEVSRMKRKIKTLGGYDDPKVMIWIIKIGQSVDIEQNNGAENENDEKMKVVEKDEITSDHKDNDMRNVEDGDKQDAKVHEQQEEGHKVEEKSLMGMEEAFEKLKKFVLQTNVSNMDEKERLSENDSCGDMELHVSPIVNNQCHDEKVNVDVPYVEKQEEQLSSLVVLPCQLKKTRSTMERKPSKFKVLITTQKQVKAEESYEESWAKLRSHLPRVNPDCKEKKQRESAMKPILDNSRSQQSNASNGVQFGVETKKLQPLQANHSELKEAFCKVLRNHPFVAK
ncbi:hypothetical protein CK203_016209 [Vitis vinifera]|uniref:Uncharacterized protein n=1 Tax=Vitis vinifera TaxID=29760 RepID=A0A438JMY4_VITVI|nr:hypothetical protein CK203_016209 [Vitis vinifera]